MEVLEAVDKLKEKYAGDRKQASAAGGATVCNLRFFLLFLRLWGLLGVSEAEFVVDACVVCCGEDIKLVWIVRL